MNWFKRLLHSFLGNTSRGAPAQQKKRHTARPVFKHFKGSGDPPAGYWKACHPSTIRIFKATITCPNGHGMTLKGHIISAEGVVQPSVVCHSCGFHEFISLAEWSLGKV